MARPAAAADVRSPPRRGGAGLFSPKGLLLVVGLLAAQALALFGVARWLQPPAADRPANIRFQKVEQSVLDPAGRPRHYALQVVLRVPRAEQERLEDAINKQLWPLFADRLQLMLSRIPAPRDRDATQEELRGQIKREVQRIFEEGLREKVPRYRDRRGLILDVELVLFDL